MSCWVWGTNLGEAGGPSRPVGRGQFSPLLPPWRQRTWGTNLAFLPLLMLLLMNKTAVRPRRSISPLPKPRFPQSLALWGVNLWQPQLPGEEGC